MINPDGDNIEILDMSGRTVATDKSGSQLVRLTVSARGVYVVRVAGKTLKVVR